MLIALIFGGLAQAASAAPSLDGITFAIQPGQIYVPLEEAARLLGWPTGVDGDPRQVRLNETERRADSFRRLVDGTLLASLAELKAAGATVFSDEDRILVIAGKPARRFPVTVAAKRVEIDLTAQQMLAWQGERNVLKTRISSGRWRRSTPTGDFTAGPYKARRHYSSKYNNAPMPWSVQVSGNVFIHGFTSVPDYPASHGCIRVPLDGGNPARFFYEWVDVGTPIRIFRE